MTKKLTPDELEAKILMEATKALSKVSVGPDYLKKETKLRKKLYEQNELLEQELDLSYAKLHKIMYSP